MKERRTRNVSPTTQLGLPELPPSMFVPKSRSKIAAMHADGSFGSVPMFMSEVLIGHSWPPNDSETSRFGEQAVHVEREWEWECVSQSVLLR